MENAVFIAIGSALFTLAFVICLHFFQKVSIASVRSEFVETVFESESLALRFKVGGTQKRQVSFAIPEERLDKVMGVQVSRGCTNRGGLTIVGQTRQ